MKLLVAVLSSLLLCAGVTSAQNPTRGKPANAARAAARSLARLAANGGSPLLNADFDSAKLPTDLTDWLKNHQPAIIGAEPDPFRSQHKWGVCTTNGNRLFLHVMKWPEGNKLSIPRLHNSVKTVRLIGQTEELELKPNVHDWDITLGDQPKRRDSLLPVVEMVMNERVAVAGTTPPIVKPSADGTILLHSRYSIVHGEMLRFEPQPHKNTVGYWVKQDDWAEWRCVAAAPGTFRVELRYGCGDGQGGSDIELLIGDSVLPFHVDATGGFQAWRDAQLGTVDLPGGRTVLVTARPKKKSKERSNGHPADHAAPGRRLVWQTNTELTVTSSKGSYDSQGVYRRLV